MLLRIVSPGWGGDVERAVERSVDTIDRVRREYEATPGAPVLDGAGTVVLVATPDDALPDVIRRVTEALTTARRVRVKAS